MITNETVDNALFLWMAVFQHCCTDIQIINNYYTSHSICGAVLTFAFFFQPKQAVYIICQRLFYGFFKFKFLLETQSCIRNAGNTISAWLLEVCTYVLTWYGGVFQRFRSGSAFLSSRYFSACLEEGVTTAERVEHRDRMGGVQSAVWPCPWRKWAASTNASQAARRARPETC